jgi:hypothetical protein
MTNPKEGGARTKVGPHNMINVALDDRPEVERRALEKKLKEEMAEARRKKLACFQKKHARGDQENHPDRHDYSNRYIYDNS